MPSAPSTTCFITYIVRILTQSCVPRARTAGLTGLAYAVEQLRLSLAAPILHLRTPNPHVMGVLDSAACYGRIAAPRMPAPLASAGAKPAALGVSAFAFQGSNAHAVVSAAPKALRGGAPRAAVTLPWAKQRVWVHPAVAPLVTRVLAVRGPTVTFQLDLRAGRSAQLWDHVVSGRPLVPGTAFLGFAAQCAALAADRGASDGAPTEVALTNVFISAPCILPTRLDAPEGAGASPAKAGGKSAHQQQQLALLCQLDVATGSVTVQSVAAGGRTVTHAAGRVAVLWVDDGISAPAVAASDAIAGGDKTGNQQCKKTYPGCLRRLVRRSLKGRKPEERGFTSAAEVQSVEGAAGAAELDAILQLGALTR